MIYEKHEITYELDCETNCGSPMPGEICPPKPAYPLPGTEILRACGAWVYAAWQFVRMLMGRW